MCNSFCVTIVLIFGRITIYYWIIIYISTKLHFLPVLEASCNLPGISYLRSEQLTAFKTECKDVLHVRDLHFKRDFNMTCVPANT